MNILLTSIISLIMTYNMPTLPYAKDALAPIISEENINYHYGKHLQTYINNLNSLVVDTPFAGKSVEEIVSVAPDGAIFNNAGQVLNHTLYFLQFTPNPERLEPEGKLAEAIKRDFGNFDNFKDEMMKTATSLFGSGWAWLALNRNGKLVIVKEANGSNPLRQGMKPLLGFDVWEHAYYLDYQNRRTDHLNNLWKIIDWKVVENRL